MKKILLLTSYFLLSLLTATSAFATNPSLVSSNVAQSTLSSSITSAASSLTLTSGALFPQTGRFRASIISPTCTSYQACAIREYVELEFAVGNTFTIHTRNAEQPGATPATWPRARHTK